MDRDRIIDKYRNGDQDRRMSFFLYYRELREAFDAIEQESTEDLSSAHSTPGRRRTSQQIAASLQALTYFLRSHLLPNQVRH